MDAKTDAASRLRRIAGQVGGIQRMLDEGRSTGELLMQIAAAQAALTETAKTILRGHVDEPLPAPKQTSGGSSDTDVNELHDIPTGSSPSMPVMTVTPVGR